MDKLGYRDNDYFNGVDYYLVETNLNKFLITKLFQYNGSWYTKEGMQYKATSIQLILVKEGLSGKRIKCIDTKEREGTGTISNFLSPYYVGINWEQGSKINPTFWVNINDKDLQLI